MRNETFLRISRPADFRELYDINCMKVGIWTGRWSRSCNPCLGVSSPQDDASVEEYSSARHYASSSSHYATPGGHYAVPSGSRHYARYGSGPCCCAAVQEEYDSRCCTAHCVPTSRHKRSHKSRKHHDSQGSYVKPLLLLLLLN